MKVSLIVPVLNEIKKVDSFLAMLQKMPGDWEILFADGGSTDGTLEHLKGKARVIACPKGRARQMNAAAREATGQVLWFVHCDSLLPQDAYRKIAAAVEGLATPGMLALMLAAIIVGAAIGAWLGSPLWKRGQARVHIRKA